MGTVYSDERDKKNTEKIERIMSDLPRCFNVYLYSINRLASSTRLLYAQKLSVFFRYLTTEHPLFMGRSADDIDYSDMDKLTYEDFDIFITHISNKQADDPGKKNKPATVNSYLAAVSNMYQLWADREYVKRNPLRQVTRNKKKRAPIVHLQGEENERFISSIYNGNNMTKQEIAFREKHNTQLRDTLMIQILDTTGIRVSELVGLDLTDIDMEHKRFTVRRKGGKIDNIYCSDSLLETLQEYIDIRPSYSPAESENALFLVSQGKYAGKRMSVRSVQLMVKKYALKSDIFGSENLTPHKLRHSYATQLLKRTGNIALVQKELGHENIRTTTIYAQADEEDLELHRNILDEE